MGTSEHRSRKLRIALAGLLLLLAAAPGVWIFFFLRYHMPEALLHATDVAWIDYCLRLLLRVAASAICMLPLLKVAERLCQRFLTRAELAELGRAFQG